MTKRIASWLMVLLPAVALVMSVAHIMSAKPAAKERRTWGTGIFAMMPLPPTTAPGTATLAVRLDVPAPQGHAQQFEQQGLLPSSATGVFDAIAGGTVWLDRMVLVNSNTSVCLVTVVDQSLTPVTLWKQLLPGYSASTPAANSVTVDFHGMVAYGGVKWSACDGTSVSGWIRVNK